MANSHTEEGQVARAKRLEDAIERLQSGQPLGESPQYANGLTGLRIDSEPSILKIQNRRQPAVSQ